MVTRQPSALDPFMLIRQSTQDEVCRMQEYSGHPKLNNIAQGKPCFRIGHLRRQGEHGPYQQGGTHKCQYTDEQYCFYR